MRMRKGAPYLFALAAFLGATQVVDASILGAGRFSAFRNADCCDAQNCYSSCQQQNRVCYKLVWDTVEQKRFHTTYQTVCETVNKQVTKTCYKDEIKTMYRDCKVTKYKDVIQECYRPVQRTCYKEVQVQQCRQEIQHCVKEVKCVVRRCVPKVCEKNCHYTVCKPVYEQHCHTQHCQVTKQICETHCREVCQKVCRPVVQHCHKEVCCQVTKCLEEQCMKQVCVPVCKDVQETCMKTVTKRWCEDVTTMKTVTRRVVECVEQPIDPCHGFGLGRGLFAHRGGIGGGNACSGDACPPGGVLHGGGRFAHRGDPCGDPCIDPCSGKTFHLLKGRRGIDAGNCNTCAPVPTTRKVWKVRCITEQVPCTTKVTRCSTEQVPFTVCKKVRYNEVKNVPYTVRRMVRGAYVDDKGVGHDCDGPGRTFREGAVARKQIPYTVTRNVTTIEKKQIPYQVSRCVRGAYVDPNDPKTGYQTDGPGRKFQEGATFAKVTTTTSCRMVKEQHVKKVQYTVYENVCEEIIKKVPYQTCRMVPYTVTKKVPYTVCEQEKYTVCKKVAYTECVKQPYTVTCKVPYQVTETIPCQVSKRVKVCVPETVCVKKARLVSYDPGHGPARFGPACHDPGHGKLLGRSRGVACHDPCHDRKWGFGRTGDCCETNKHCMMSGLRQRWQTSLVSTGCCQDTCRGGACSTSHRDTCGDHCRESMLNRLFRNRFACDPCCTGTAPATPVVPAPAAAPARPLPQADPVSQPKSLPNS